MNIPLNIDWRQILLHWMNLVILTGGLYFLLYKPVHDFMERREARYRAREEETAKNLAESEALRAEAQARLDGVEEELAKLRDASEEASRRKAEEELSQARAQAHRIIVQAEQTAEENRRRILRESQRELQQLATETARKLAFAPGTDPFDEFLDLTERSGGDG